MENIKIGDTIKIIEMKDEPHDKDRVGVVTHIDAGQIHRTWGGCAIIPEVDDFAVIEQNNLYNRKIPALN